MLFFKDEAKREHTFYKSRGLPNPKVNQTNMTYDNNTIGNNTKNRPNEKEDVVVVAVVLELKCASNSSNVMTEMKRYFIKCNQYSMIGHLQKFIATKVLNGAIDFGKVKFP